MGLKSAWLGLFLVGCGPVVGLDEEGTGGRETEGSAEGPMTGVPGTSGTTVPATTVASTTSTSTTTSTTTTDSSGEDVGTSIDPTCGFICPPDFVDSIECSIFEQDCPVGEKCMPWANDGGNSWNATKCSRLDDDPDAPGESCTVEGSGVSGVDSCDATSMCWNVDPDTLEGTCHAFCTGDESSPSCANECDWCTISGDGVLTICLPTCDPNAQDCGPGSGCYLGSTSYFCAPDASGMGGAVAEPCEYPNACDPGNLCVTGDALPECAELGCCTPFCVVGDDTPCAAIPGTSCVALYDDPPGCAAANVGACVLPP